MMQWCNDEFELPDVYYHMVSDIQDYMKYIIKKHKTLIAIPPILAYINRVNNILVFEINDGYKPELKMSKTMKLSGSTKRKKIGKKRRRCTNSWSIWSIFSPMQFNRE